MIVSCPACSARYRIDPSKIKGRGAKITCPRCAHKFVVYKDRSQTTSADPPAEAMRSTSAILTRDFRRVGVTWRVRKPMGVTYSFHDLQSLMDHIEAGRVEGRDSLSYDARTWVPMDSIEDLRAYFEDIWRKAERGEIAPPQPRQERRPSYLADDEEEEGPTTIMGHGHALMDDIRKAVAEATTPPPSVSRQANPASPPRPPPAPPPPQDMPTDDPTTFSRRASTPRPSHLTPSTSDVRAVRPPGSGGSGEPPPRRPSRPAPPQDSGFDRENIGVILISVLAIILVGAALFGAFWTMGLIKFGEVQPPPPTSGPSVAPLSPASQDMAGPPSGAVDADDAADTDAADTDATAPEGGADGAAPDDTPR
jgi:predicted Zn finger-like uncharacterized protein